MQKSPRAPRLILALVCLFHIAVNILWLTRDDRPPAWDMALHQQYALNFYHFFKHPSREVFKKMPDFTGNYPPFFHIIVGLLFFVFHRGPHIAALANIPALVVLVFTTYAIGRRLQDEETALLGAIFLSFFPFMVWISREVLIDYTLTAATTLAMWLLLKTETFSSRRYSWLFGFALGAGMLTKWTFIAFLILPIGLTLYQGRVLTDKEKLKNALGAALLGCALALLWYVPNLPKLRSNLLANAQVGVLEGDPPILSFQSFIYYLRLLEGYQLFALFSLLFCLGVFYALWTQPRRYLILFAWMLGGWLFMTALRNKDPRHTMPLLPAVALIAASGFERLRATKSRAWILSGIGAVILAQDYMINFGLPFLPDKVVIAQGYTGEFSWNWNLYIQRYFFDLLGPPRKKNWPLLEILNLIAEDAKARGTAPALGVVPDFARLGSGNLSLYAELYDIPVTVVRIGSQGGMELFADVNYVLLSEGDQGVKWSTRYNRNINQFILDHPEVFQVLKVLTLPNGESIRIYHIFRKN